jgi:hypothetical protein
MLDASAGQAASYATRNASTTPAITQNSNDLLFAGFVNSNSSGTITPGSMWTGEITDTSFYMMAEDQTVSTVGSYTATATMPRSDADWVATFAAFKATANCSSDDGASVKAVAATATSVPFGIISPNTFYQGCQDLIVSTNAGNGYSLTVQESSAMKTIDGRFTIPDTTRDAGTCSESAAAAWTTATHNGLGHTCANQLNHDCNSAYSSGTLFRQAADLSQGETAQSVMSSSTAATATGRMKYLLSAGNAQAAGTYTTLITYTIYAAY